MYTYIVFLSFQGDVRGTQSGGNSSSRYNTNQYDVQPAGEIHKDDLLVKINSAERKSDTPDKSPQVQSAGIREAICVNLWLRTKAATVSLCLINSVH